MWANQSFSQRKSEEKQVGERCLFLWRSGMEAKINSWTSPSITPHGTYVCRKNIFILTREKTIRSSVHTANIYLLNRWSKVILIGSDWSNWGVHTVWCSFILIGLWCWLLLEYYSRFCVNTLRVPKIIYVLLFNGFVKLKHVNHDSSPSTHRDEVCCVVGIEHSSV